jgi:hypothetical protein
MHEGESEIKIAATSYRKYEEGKQQGQNEICNVEDGNKCLFSFFAGNRRRRKVFLFAFKLSNKFDVFSGGRFRSLDARMWNIPFP